MFKSVYCDKIEILHTIIQVNFKFHTYFRILTRAPKCNKLRIRRFSRGNGKYKILYNIILYATDQYGLYSTDYK